MISYIDILCDLGNPFKSMPTSFNNLLFWNLWKLFNILCNLVLSKLPLCVFSPCVCAPFFSFSSHPLKSMEKGCSSLVWASIYPIQYFSLSILFKIYRLFGILIVVATNLLELLFLSSQFLKLNVRMCPRSHIRLTLRRLCFIPSTSETFYYLFFSFPTLTMPFPIISQGTSFWKVALPFFLSLFVFNIKN